MRASVKAVTIILGAALCVSGAAADDASEVAEMRRELGDLRAEVRALRQAMSEVAELTRRSAEVWSSALTDEPEVRSQPIAETGPGRGRPKASAPALPRETRTRREPAQEGARTGTLEGRIKVPSGEPVAYVYVENVPGAPVREQVTIDQKNKRFVPSWAVVRSGTTITFPNSDNIYHNVFSLSSGNTFDLGLYNSGEKAKTHTFSAPGAVDVYCNIHPQMAASVLVVPNELFAKVKPDGTFSIRNVPQGQRKIVAWSPGAKLTSQWIDVGEGTTQLELALEPKSRVHKNKEGRAYGSYE